MHTFNVKVFNYSTNDSSLDYFLANRTYLDWARSRPNFTLIHLGGASAVKSKFNDFHAHIEFMKQIAVTFKDRAGAELRGWSY